VYAGTNGFLDKFPVDSLGRYEQELYAFLEASHADIFKEIVEKKVLGDDLKKRLNAAIEAFNAKFEATVKK
jgi:F-type H+-transporting ATPase subunit alpha